MTLNIFATAAILFVAVRELNSSPMGVKLWDSLPSLIALALVTWAVWS